MFKIERTATTKSPGWIVVCATGEGFGYWIDSIGRLSNADGEKFATLPQLMYSTYNATLQHSDKCRFYNDGIYCDCYALAESIA